MTTAPPTDRRNFYQSLLQREQATRSAERKRRSRTDPFSTAELSNSPLPNPSIIEEYHMSRVSFTAQEPESSLNVLAKRLKQQENSLLVQKQQQEAHQRHIAKLKDNLKELKRLSNFYQNKVYQDELELSELGKQVEPNDHTLKFSFGPTEPGLSAALRTFAVLKDKIVELGEKNRSEALEELEKRLMWLYNDLHGKEKLALEAQVQLLSLNEHLSKKKSPHNLLSGIKSVVEFAQKRLQVLQVARELDEEISRLKADAKSTPLHASRPSMYNKSLHFSSLKELPKLTDEETEKTKKNRNNLLNANRSRAVKLTEFDSGSKKGEFDSNGAKAPIKQGLVKEISTVSLGKCNSVYSNSYRSTLVSQRSKAFPANKRLLNYSKLADKTVERHNYSTLKPNTRKAQGQPPSLSRSQHEISEPDHRDPLAASLQFYKSKNRKSSREPRPTPSFYDKLMGQRATNQQNGHLYFPDRQSPTLYTKFANKLNNSPVDVCSEVFVPFESNIKDKPLNPWMQLQKETRPSARSRAPTLLKSQRLNRNDPRSRSITPLNLPSSLSHDIGPTSSKVAPESTRPFQKAVPSLPESKFKTASKIEIIALKGHKPSVRPTIDTPKFSETSKKQHGTAKFAPEAWSFQDLMKKPAINQEISRVSRIPAYKKYITLEVLPSDSGKTGGARLNQQMSGVKATPSSISSLIFKKLAVNRFK